MSEIKQRDQWGSRIGLILAVAGNAVGLGNFLRFPVQAASNGGGAFMIPYFISFLLIGIPLMWIEWGIGRHGGQYGHGSAPGMFDVLWKNKLAKYVGAFGMFSSTIILIYYTYVESWTLGYSFLSITKSYFGAGSFEALKTFLYSYQGKISSQYFDGLTVAYIFLIITFVLNFYVLYKGISQGIEKLAKIAMPLLFLFAIIIAIRVITLGTPDPTHPENSVGAGFAFVWNPNFAYLADPKVWLAAAGQIFFTLSLGMGTIHAYASFLKPKDDIALNGITTAATNEFAEVCLGGSIAIPLAVAFFGVATATAMAKGGSYDLGFASMPLVFEQLPMGQILGFMWFALLFFAGITSSVAMGQQVVAFLEDEFGWNRKKTIAIFGAFVFLSIHLVIFYLKYGFMDEMDYWAGTFMLVVFALAETVVFIWVFGADKAWEQMNMGGDIKIPRMFYYIMKYITPTALLIIMISWIVNDAIPILMLKGADPVNIPYIWGARLFMLAVMAALIYLIHLSWKRKGALK